MSRFTAFARKECICLVRPLGVGERLKDRARCHRSKNTSDRSLQEAELRLINILGLWQFGVLNQATGSCQGHVPGMMWLEGVREDKEGMPTATGQWIPSRL